MNCCHIGVHLSPQLVSQDFLKCEKTDEDTLEFKLPDKGKKYLRNRNVSWCSLGGTVTSTMSLKADSDTDKRADVDRTREGSSNEKETPESLRVHSKMLLWMKRLNSGPVVTLCHLCCLVVWNNNGDLEMLGQKESAIVDQSSGTEFLDHASVGRLL